MDERGRELERRVARDPADSASVQALVQHMVRTGDLQAAQGAVATAIVAGARGAELVPALRAARVPLRVVPHGSGQELAAIVGDSALPFAALPCAVGTRMWTGDGLAAGLAYPAADLAALQAHIDEVRRRVAESPSRASAEGRERAVEYLAGPPPEQRRGGTLVHVLAVGEGLSPLPGSPFQLPGQLVGHCLLVIGTTLFVGGRDEGEPGQLLVVRDLGAPEAPWQRVELPPEACGHGKAVDALLLRPGGSLIAVDDIVLPKWNFVLDVRVPLAPRVVSSTPIPAHYTYERIHAASLGGRWVALLSHGGGQGGAAQFVALLDAETLEERALLAEVGTGADWQDVLVAGQTLLVAAGRPGVVALSLAPPPAGRLPGTALRPLRDLRLEDHEAVVRLTYLDATRCLASVARDRRPHRHPVVRLA